MLFTYTHKLYIVYLLLKIGSFLLIEYIILFLNLPKLLYPFAFLIIVFILEFTPSIAPFDNRLPLTILNEFLISVFQVLNNLPKYLYSSRCESKKLFIKPISSFSHVSKSAVRLNSLYLSLSLYAYSRSLSILNKYFKISSFFHSVLIFCILIGPANMPS